MPDFCHGPLHPGEDRDGSRLRAGPCPIPVKGPGILDGSQATVASDDICLSDIPEGKSGATEDLAIWLPYAVRECR